MAALMTPQQLDKLATAIARKMIDAQDEMIPLQRVAAEKGLSKSYLYHHAALLGGVKSLGKWFFSRQNIERILRSGTAL